MIPMKKSDGLVYRIVRFLANLFYPKLQVAGAENLPQEACVIVGNHCKTNGPIAAELYIPGERYIWCAQEMMHWKEVPAYTYRDFWSRKPKWSKWLYKLLSYLITPLCVLIFNCAHTIPVYRDGRVVKTYRETLNKLKDGANVVIFPEHDAPYDHILCDFQTGFVDTARSYYKQTGKKLQFVPMYLAPKLKMLVFGKPITFDPENPIKEERRRICDYLMAEISATAQALPRHIVVPYNNIPEKDYVYNRPLEVTEHENTCG